MSLLNDISRLLGSDDKDILHRARNSLRRCLEQTWFCAGERPC